MRMSAAIDMIMNSYSPADLYEYHYTHLNLSPHINTGCFCSALWIFSVSNIKNCKAVIVSISEVPENHLQSCRNTNNLEDSY